MPTWRKILFGVIIAAMVVSVFVFWNTAFSALCVVLLIQSLPIYAFNRYADMDLAQQFDNGINVKGWK